MERLYPIIEDTLTSVIVNCPYRITEPGKRVARQLICFGMNVELKKITAMRIRISRTTEKIERNECKEQAIKLCLMDVSG